MVIAHRGGAELFVENTLSAFIKAEELGVDAIECDVHVSKDGHLVVSHDSSLKRVFGVDREIKDMNLQEIKSVRLPDGESPPTLLEVLDKVSVTLIVELKSFETLNAMHELFESMPETTGRCIVISFYHEALLMLKSQHPSLQTGALLAGYPVDPVSVAKSCGSGTLLFYHEGMMKQYVDRCHEGGIEVSVWTPNSEKDIQNCIEAGVDSIGSDRPDLVLRLLGRR